MEKSDSEILGTFTAEVTLVSREGDFSTYSLNILNSDGSTESKEETVLTSSLVGLTLEFGYRKAGVAGTRIKLPSGNVGVNYNHID